MKKTTSKLLSVCIIAALVLNISGCRVIYRDNESQITSTGYRTVTISEGGESSTVSGGVVSSISNKPGEDRKVTADTEKAEKKLSGTLELQIFTNESQTADSGWTDVIDAFEKETGIKVNTVIGSQVNTQMSTRWMQNNPPDFIWIDGTGIPDAVYQSGGKYLDITSMLKDDYVFGTDTKISDVLDNDTLVPHKGKYYHAPVMMATHGLWYDKAYLSKLGISVPVNYDEFVTASQKAVTAGTAAFTYPGQYTSYCFGGLIMPALGAYGQDYLDAVLSADASAFTDERMTSVLRRYRDYCTTRGFVLSGTTTMDHTTSQVRWLGHKALFITNGLWLADEVRKSTPASFDMDYVTSPLVTAQQKQTAVFYTKYAAIAAGAKNTENAKAFMRFLYTEFAQKKLMSSFGYMSVRKDIDYTNATAYMTKAAARCLNYVNEGRKSGQVNVVYMHDDWGDVGEIFYNQINSLTNGTITVEKAQQEMKKACEEYRR